MRASDYIARRPRGLEATCVTNEHVTLSLARSLGYVAWRDLAWLDQPDRTEPADDLEPHLRSDVLHLLGASGGQVVRRYPEEDQERPGDGGHGVLDGVDPRAHRQLQVRAYLSEAVVHQHHPGKLKLFLPPPPLFERCRVRVGLGSRRSLLVAWLPPPTSTAGVGPKATS